ncbi:PGPGW domain-containing protein [Alteromonas facilis]|uniref:PGPGW domain-containing protein n=1 Tax=Alteromonas facilis TaxID=2048004 RepID=UPI000C293B9C|nr:PGPGW domain-containing protein [Alteromonas facilis]
MLAKTTRTLLGGSLLAVGIVFTIVPGSILLVLMGLVILSIDHALPRKWLKVAQKGMSNGARKLDSWLLNRR